MTAYVHMPRCADGTYYVGSTRASLEDRVAQHNAENFNGYTASRRPVALVFQKDFSASPMRSRQSGSSRAGAAQRKKLSRRGTMKRYMPSPAIDREAINETLTSRVLRLGADAPAQDEEDLI